MSFRFPRVGTATFDPAMVILPVARYPRVPPKSSRKTRKTPLPPGPRRESHENEHPAHRHPPGGVEAHDVGAPARLGPEVVPAPAAVVRGFWRVGHDVSS